MKNLKIKLWLFSLLAVLSASVFLTSCEQEALVDPHDDFDSIVLSEKIATDGNQSQDYIDFEKVKKHVKIRNGQLTLTESFKSENFTKKQSKDISSHLEKINNQVLNGKTDITAEGVLNGAEYTITYKANEGGVEEKSGCTGETKAEVTYTWIYPTGVTLYLNSCDTNNLITVGCATLGYGISLLDGPLPFADLIGLFSGIDCGLYLSKIVNENCDYGVIIRVSVLYKLEYVKCQSPPGCLNYNAWNHFTSTGWIYVYEYPASWVWSNKYQDFIKLYNQTDICDYGVSFQANNPICGRSGQMWDYDASDHSLWNWTGSQWISYYTGTCFTGLIVEDEGTNEVYDNENVKNAQNSLSHNVPSDIISNTIPEVLPEYLFSKTVSNQPTLSVPSFDLDADM